MLPVLTIGRLIVFRIAIISHIHAIGLLPPLSPLALSFFLSFSPHCPNNETARQTDFICLSACTHYTSSSARDACDDRHKQIVLLLRIPASVTNKKMIREIKNKVRVDFFLRGSRRFLCTFLSHVMQILCEFILSIGIDELWLPAEHISIIIVYMVFFLSLF